MRNVWNTKILQGKEVWRRKATEQDELERAEMLKEGPVSKERVQRRIHLGPWLPYSPCPLSSLGQMVVVGFLHMFAVSDYRSLAERNRVVGEPEK